MKKGLAFEFLVKAILVIAIAVILMFVYKNLLGKQSEVGETQISRLTTDFDDDGIKDVIDKCPCDSGEHEKCPTSSRDCELLLRAK